MHRLLLATVLFLPLSWNANAQETSVSAQETEEAAQSLTIPLFMATEQGQGASIGNVTVTESRYGLVFTPALKNVTPGLHGFHIHANPDCGPLMAADGKVTPAGAAGGHFDPDGTNRHSTPWDDGGHLGDLPALYVAPDGTATEPVLAPKFGSIEDLKHHALMVHAGSDNYSDTPQPLGGGAARLACGVIK